MALTQDSGTGSGLADKAPGCVPVVLVVEDDAATARVLCAALDRAGWASACVGSAEEALALLADGQTLTALIIDVGLPGMSGLTLASSLQRSAPSLPFIVLTANDDDATLCEATAAGALSYLVKPITPAHLAPILRAALARHREAQNLEQTATAHHCIAVAAGILMRTHQVSQRAALQLMQRAACAIDAESSGAFGEAPDHPLLL